MKCSKCGKENDKSAIFCKNCGERLIAAPEDVSIAVDLISEDASKNKKEKSSEKKSDCKAKNTEQKTAKTASKQSKASEYVANEIASPLSRAWGDIIHTPKWFARGLIVGLINCVPVLSFAATGYAQKGGVEAQTNKTGEMPTNYVTSKTFLTGFFEFVTWIVYLLAGGVATWILNSSIGTLPIIGILVSIALAVAAFFWNSIISLASMKCALTDELGQSFAFKEIFTKWSKGGGQLFTSYFVPAILCGLIGLGIGLILLGLGTASVIPAITSLFSDSMSSSFTITGMTGILTSYLPVILKIISSCTIFIILFIVEYCICDGFEKVIRYRAVGYGIDKYAKDGK